jgi:hypothetical protein
VLRKLSAEDELDESLSKDDDEIDNLARDSWMLFEWEFCLCLALDSSMIFGSDFFFALKCFEHTLNVKALIFKFLPPKHFLGDLLLNRLTSFPVVEVFALVANLAEILHTPSSLERVAASASFYVL